jgi:hypothetical protein
VLVEKTPRHIRKVDLIREVAPRAKLLIPVRDGRDVAASYAKRFEGGFAEGIQRWISDNRLVLEQRGRRDVLIYRYEDFIEDAERTANDICDFLGIDYDAAMFEYHKQPRNWFGEADVKETGRREHNAYRNWQVNQPIFDGRGSWRADYSEADMAPLLSGAGLEVMKAFGYA